MALLDTLSSTHEKTGSRNLHRDAGWLPACGWPNAPPLSGGQRGTGVRGMPSTRRKGPGREAAGDGGEDSGPLDGVGEGVGEGEEGVGECREGDLRAVRGLEGEIRRRGREDGVRVTGGA